ncbi:nitrilase-related carbon-nitrogen hydrolase [Sediminispirochaeta smaragdinae]|jgi:predicted amidohydrolase|uniref:Nitrilase/cyanide hydratase and apolipoprotein N-acyltransferase n=1 Tax=Sediminispirochaeta smaragdinae (strain DSM 11293 / JCM 15392 / SEBR 4228) TaxID=573413 RepID=E1R8K3_SEDSS|nr:nitrilase-related carbon-nitrogen hydrolase [Sediminispirochaeta smaragdinae]ADK79347.1 Nitrilase/cyanide hydratase and apolipoprotein N-acyltransferase [Sediminispirochaeta smaragdinae DSM 11293]
MAGEDKLRIGLAVMEARPGDVRHNAAIVEHLCDEAAEAGAMLICFPEAALTSYSGPKARELALYPEEVAAILLPLADRYGLTIFCGFIEAGESGGKPFVSQAVALPGASEIGLYRKSHLGTLEQEWFEAGNEIGLFDIGTMIGVGGSAGPTVGIQLCIETHLPEIALAQSLRGAALILAPFASPLSAQRRRELWLRYLPARAYDNGLYVASCNLCGGRFGGGALIIDPKGQAVVEDFSGRQALLCADIDLSLVKDLRQQKSTKDPAMGDRWYPSLRRPELY